MKLRNVKLSTLAALAAMTVATASQSFASSENVTFKPLNESLETQACLTAATEGMRATRKLVRENDVDFGLFNKSVTCNGMKLAQFANTYFEQDTTEEPKVVAIRASNSNLESQLCLDAVLMGEEQARQKHDLHGVSVICNDKPLSSFVRSMTRDNIVVKLAD